MAKYKVKDFAIAYGIKESTVKSYVHRKQLQRDADGYIDTENDKNRLFILDLGLKKETGKVSQVAEKETKKSKVVASERPTGQTESQKQYLDLDLRTRIATAEAKEHESALKRMQLEKMAGNLLPVDLVENIFVINLQTIFKTFEGELENIASLFVTDRKELTEVMVKQKELLAKVIEKAKSDAMHEIDNAIDEYKEVRSRGERK